MPDWLLVGMGALCLGAATLVVIKQMTIDVDAERRHMGKGGGSISGREARMTGSKSDSRVAKTQCHDSECVS